MKVLEMKGQLRKIARIASSLLLISQTACWECSLDRNLTHPIRPTQVHGWKKLQRGSVTVDGDFVLELGKFADNGRVGVKVVGLAPAKCRAFREPELPSAQIQFINVGDGKVICESKFQTGSAFLRRPHLCGANFEWDVIGIKAINAEDKWVAFELVK